MNGDNIATMKSKWILQDEQLMAYWDQTSKKKKKKIEDEQHNESWRDKYSIGVKR